LTIPLDDFTQPLWRRFARGGFRGMGNFHLRAEVERRGQCPIQL
jgi:hypothetical protein